MSIFEYIIGGVLIIFSLLIIVAVLLQEGRQANLGVISGAADSFMDKATAKSWDARLAKITRTLAIIFFVLVLGGMLTTKFLSKSALASYSAKQESTQNSETEDDTSKDVQGTDDGEVDIDDQASK